jgi:L-gulonate 5-dehydrogenase
VVFDPVNSCGKCLPCLIGRGNVCENLKVNGAHVDGGFAQYIVCEERKLHPISKDVPWDIAAMAEPFTIGAQAASRGGLRAGDRVLIVGAGPIGQVALQVCKAGGATVSMCDLSLARLELARENGADDAFQAGQMGLKEFLDSRGLMPFTLAIDAVGAPHILPEILSVMSPAGRVVLLGFNADATPIRQLDITRRELDVVGSRLSIGQFPKVVDWIQRGIVHPEKIITHRLPFEHALDGLLLMQDHPDECCKVILEF